MLRRLVHEERGAQTLEWLAVLIIVLGIAFALKPMFDGNTGIMKKVGSQIETKINDAFK